MIKVFVSCLFNSFRRALNPEWVFTNRAIFQPQKIIIGYGTITSRILAKNHAIVNTSLSLFSIKMFLFKKHLIQKQMRMVSYVKGLIIGIKVFVIFRWDWTI